MDVEKIELKPNTSIIIAAGYYGDMDEKWFEEYKCESPEEEVNLLMILTNLPSDMSKEETCEHLKGLGFDVTEDSFPYNWQYECCPSVELITVLRSDAEGKLSYYRVFG